MPTLPEGFRVRAPTLEDATRVLELLNACDLADYGEPDTDLEDVLVDWRRPGFELQVDAVLVLSGKDELAAIGDVYQGKDAAVAVHPQWRGRGVGSYLLDWTEHRAREHAGPGTTLGQFAGGGETGARPLLEARGYAPVRFIRRMELDLLANPPARPEAPGGITIRSFRPGSDDRAVHQLVQEAFAEGWDHQEQPFDEWRAFMMDRDTFDPTLWFIATHGDEVVGTALCPNYPDMGWIRQVAVRSPHRRRGIGRALLLTALHEFAARGRTRAGLTVEADNRTRAGSLYEGAGMSMVREFVRLEKRLV